MNIIATKLKKGDETSNKLTTIAISKENYFILKKMGQTSDSFNDVLSKLLKNQPLVEKTDF